jgi:hypothetical protein
MSQIRRIMLASEVSSGSRSQPAAKECSRTKPPAKVSNFRAARKDPEREREIISAGSGNSKMFIRCRPTHTHTRILEIWRRNVSPADQFSNQFEI